MKKSFLHLSLVLLVLSVFFLIHFSSEDERLLPEQKALKEITHTAGLLFMPGNEKVSGAELDSLYEASEGKGLLVNFGAEWCGACKREKENLRKIFTANKKLPFIRVLVPEEEENFNLSEFNKDLYPLFLDKDKKLTETYKITALPQTLLFNEEGELIYRHRGALDSSKSLLSLQKNIDSFLSRQKIRSEKQEKTNLKNDPLGSKLFSFSLENSEAKTFSSKELEEKVWLANFIFTSCPSICPTLTKKMRRFQDEFVEDKNFELVSFSVDPENDLPAKLKAYKQKYEMKTNWHLLTGAWPLIQKIIRDGFKIGAPENPMFHSEKFVLLDKNLEIKGFYSSYSPQDIQRLRKDIKVLLLKYKTSSYSIIKKDKKKKRKAS